MIAESVEPVGGEVPGDDGREVGDRPLSASSSGRQVKMVGSGRVVFGEAPPGVVCTKRPAAYVVISGRDGRVAAVRPTARGGRQFWLPGGGSHPGETPEATVVREAEFERSPVSTGEDELCWVDGSP
jgi:hypothetical protein